jgi:hypothetical protein
MNVENINSALFRFQVTGQLAKLTSVVFLEVSKFSIDINAFQEKISQFLLAVDEIQVLAHSTWDGLYCKNRSTGEIMSFARFFTWTNERLKVLQTVISGTDIGITNLDSITSAINKREHEIPVDIITKFDV